MSWFGEFKAFIQRGNVIDLAVAVIMGAAFTKVVTALVDHIFSPPLGLVTSHFNDLFVGPGEKSGFLTHIGAFLQSVADFVIIAFCVFLIVKAVNSLHVQKLLEGDPKPIELTTQEKLLTEIRDLLKAQQTPAPAPAVPMPTPNEAERPV
jgi:large conductance mechanosensitive channel